MNSKNSNAELNLRAATNSDKKLLWEWANDPAVREAAFDQDPIDWSTHEDWFDKRIDDPSCRIYIAEVDGQPAGQIRFEQEVEETVVDVSVSREFRGRGYGSSLIQKGSDRFLQESEQGTVTAYVKTSNEKSQKAFENAGYQKKGQLTKEGYPVIQYVYGPNSADDTE